MWFGRWRTVRLPCAPCFPPLKSAAGGRGAAVGCPVAPRADPAAGRGFRDGRRRWIAGSWAGSRRRGGRVVRRGLRGPFPSWGRAVVRAVYRGRSGGRRVSVAGLRGSGVPGCGAWCSWRGGAGDVSWRGGAGDVVIVAVVFFLTALFRRRPAVAADAGRAARGGAVGGPALIVAGVSTVLCWGVGLLARGGVHPLWCPVASWAYGRRGPGGGGVRMTEDAAVRAADRR